MATLVIRIVIGLLLMIHGFAHWQITSGWGKVTADSAVLRAAGMGDGALASLGAALWVVALLSFNLAAIGVFAGQGRVWPALVPQCGAAQRPGLGHGSRASRSRRYPAFPRQ